MIVITAKFRVKAEHADSWPEITRAFTEATRAEAGNHWFDWSRSVEDPQEYVLLEAFDDDAAGPHVNSDHFRQAQTDLPPYLEQTPQIINGVLDIEGWSELGEMKVN